MHPSVRTAAIALGLLFGAAASKADGKPGRVTVRRPDEVEFGATVNARPFDKGWLMPGYHAIVWKGGRAAHHALFQADVTDRQVLEALVSLGAKPGNNLPMEAWDERNNPHHRAPETVIAGPPVEILLRLPGRRALTPLASVLEDSAGRGLAMRFGGNEKNIPEWMSGCIVCLYSCPGSKVGNSRYTVRDYARGVTRFRVRKGLLPEDGSRVGVVLRLVRSSEDLTVPRPPSA